ncbi:MAG: YlcI/YnfO family protein [Phycisphaerae bacterium]
MITIRIEPEIKDLIEQAAVQEGLSISSFMIAAATARAARAKPRSTKRRHRDGAPAYLHHACHTARNGGPRGYWAVGYEAARHVESLQPSSVEDPEKWSEMVDEFCDNLLSDAEQRQDPTLVVAWFREHLPNVMALVPSRRHEQFALGAIECYHDGKIE